MAGTFPYTFPIDFTETPLNYLLGELELTPILQMSVAFGDFT